MHLNPRKRNGLIQSKICRSCCWYYIPKPTLEDHHKVFSLPSSLHLVPYSVWFLAPWLCTWYTWGEDASGPQPSELCGRSISDTQPGDGQCEGLGCCYYCRPGDCRAGSACTPCWSRTPRTPPPDHGQPPGPDHRFYKGDCPAQGRLCLCNCVGVEFNPYNLASQPAKLLLEVMSLATRTCRGFLRQPSVLLKLS